uniref:UDP-glycosyltransferase 74E2-like n=1 Tax=Nelumbo nucifera TaxID=4432 RepID=A0A822XU66_NELNU|nr:TPA_asm: hypothetical protein HUJ06_026628 [Nelumbo nucifera]
MLLNCNQVVEWMTKRLPTPLLTIGPAVPSMYLDKRVAGDKDYGLNLFKPDKGSCMNWLDKRAARSVVYVSFGSMAALSAEQIEEIAWGLRRSNTYFLWVLRSDQDDKLPGEFLMETAEKGLIVRWCSQLEVLAREAIGCFITHCGWNSTLEALSTGVAMVGMPQWTDQTTNAKLVMDVWRIGVRARPDDKGIVSREEVERCIVEVMEGERGKQIKKNAIKWKNLAREAVDEGGSSDKNIDGFIAKLVSLKCDCLRK